MRKKLVGTALALTLVVGTVLNACGSKEAETQKLVVGATPSPHAEILELVKDDLQKEGIELEIQEFTDYVTPNTALDDGSIDANYFQHLPYLESFNEENDADLVSAGTIHYEPFGIYPGKSDSLDNIKEGATIAVPNDTSNEARALLLLQDAGLITLKDGVELEATVEDITENPKNLEIQEVEAATIPRVLADVDFAAINGNYALEADLNPAEDALFVEAADSVAAQTYANIIAVKAEDKEDEKIQALIKALQSDEVKDYIEENYSGAVVAIF